MLTGPPRFAGILRPYCSQGAWLDCTWDDSESIWLQYDSGREELVTPHLRLIGRGGWEAATEAEALAFQADLQGTFAVCPRTRAPGDPAWAEEIEVMCRLTSPLPATTPLYRRGADGRPVWEVNIQFRSLATYPQIPGVPRGGFYLIGRQAGAAVLEPYGEATAPSGRYTVTYRGVQYERASALLGPAPLVAMRATEGEAPGTAVLTTPSKPD